MKNYFIASTPETPLNIEKAEKAKQQAEEKKEEARKAREERDARIEARRKQHMEELAAQQADRSR